MDRTVVVGVCKVRFLVNGKTVWLKILKVPVIPQIQRSFVHIDIELKHFHLCGNIYLEGFQSALCSNALLSTNWSHYYLAEQL